MSKSTYVAVTRAVLMAKLITEAAQARTSLSGKG